MARHGIADGPGPRVAGAHREIAAALARREDEHAGEEEAGDARHVVPGFESEARAGPSSRRSAVVSFGAEMPFAAPSGTTLVEPLGAGMVFEVALVREGDVTLVCKRLTSRVRGERAGRAAIVREAKALARARHPALPVLVRVGNDEHGPFLLETRVAGVSVARLVERWGAVPRFLVAHVASMASATLAELHALADANGPIGLVHGDLGPEHVILAPTGEVGFVDLGAARFLGMEPELETEDRGTLPFAAPEVARGEARPSQAGDVYALAATLVFLATGGPLTEATGDAPMLLEIGERGLSASLVDRAAGISPKLREALRRAIAKDPAARLSSAAELAQSSSAEAIAS